MGPPWPLHRLLPAISSSGFDSLFFTPSFKDPWAPGPWHILDQHLLSQRVNKGTSQQTTAHSTGSDERWDQRVSLKPWSQRQFVKELSLLETLVVLGPRRCMNSFTECLMTRCSLGSGQGLPRWVKHSFSPLKDPRPVRDRHMNKHEM